MSAQHETRTPPWRANVRRRRLFQGAIGAAGLAAAGAGTVGIADAQEGPVGTLQSSHPGMLHTQADLDRMADKVAEGAEPWISGWEKLVANGRSHSTWEPRPVEVVVRGGGQDENYAQLYLDIAAAYQNALRWRITGDTAHGDTARDICNAWSRTLKSIDPTHSDSRLASGIYGYQFANVGELIRDYDGFDLARFQDMMLNVFYPLNSDFLVRHNDTCDSHYWANWDLCNMASIMAIGILRDDQAQFDEAVDYFYNGAGNGAIDHAIPFLHDGGLAQWQESGRDQGHSIMGIGLMAAFMEMAWNQGLDLYSANDNAFAKAAEYVARYNLGYNDVPFTTYSWGFGHNCDYREHTVISEGGRGEQRPVWEMIYNHYSVRHGLEMPNVARMAASLRPEGGGGDYGPNSGGYDALGFGTLANTLPTPPVVSGGVYTLTCERSGKVLDNAASDEDGQRVIQWGANGGTQQRWHITDVGGYHRLLCQYSGKALDNGNTATEGARVIQWTDNRGPQQRWRIIDVGGGAVKLTCERSGMVLDNGNGEADGDGVIQWRDNGGPQQRWRLHRIA